jgi:IS4 transposase
MNDSQIRINKDIILIQQDAFRDIARGDNSNNFRRERKMGLKDLVFSLMTRKGISSNMDIRNYYKTKNIDDSISNPGFHKQRMKLNPEAFAFLNNHHVKSFYEMETDLKKFKNHYVFAIDGSKVVLPTTEETLEVYGGQSNKSKIVAMLGFSAIYDVLNNMILDGTIDRYNYSERASAEIHLNKLTDYLGDSNRIILFDRGYPSAKLLLFMINTPNKFVMRLSSIQFKREQKSMKTDDQWIDINFTQNRINPYRGTPFAEELRKVKGLTLRFVKIHLPNDDVEYLLTNLESDIFSEENIGELYRMRWGIETVYDVLKNKIQMANFSGKKPIIIEQDIYVSIYLCNLIHDIIRDVQKEFDENNEKQYKYEMTINKNLAIGIMKEDLIHILLMNNQQKQQKMFDRIYKDIRINIVPVRPERSYERGSKYPSYKHPLTKKRSF